MENEQPELIARPRKSKTPLIIGIVVAIHVVLIGSAFIIQEIHKRGQAPAPEVVESSSTSPANEFGEAAPQPDPFTMPPAATEAATPQAQKPAVATITAPEKRGDLTLPAPASKKTVAKAEPVATKATKVIAKSYTVKKGDTWKSVASRLKVPVQQLAADNKLDAKKFLKVGQKLAYRQTVQAKATTVAAAAAPKAPATVASVPKTEPAITPAAEPQTQTFALYEVKKGDTLGTIATRHAMRVTDLRSANELKNDKIVIGQKLKVQQPGPKPAVQNLAADVEPRESAPQVHVVAKGETLSELAHRYGVTTAELLKANSIQDPTKVLVGQKLKIPSLEFPGSRASLEPSVVQETLNPPLESTTKI